MNSFGDLIWQKTLGGSQKDQPRGLVITNDGGCIVTGRTNSINGDVTNTVLGYCGWMVKLNSFGEIEWQKCFESGVINAVVYIPILNQYCITGYGEGLGGNAWIAKTDNMGAIIWQTFYGGSGYDDARAIELGADGGFLTCAVTYSADGDVTNYKGEGDFWLVKFDKNGQLEWEKTLGGSGGDIPYAMTLSALGEIILAGTTSSTDGDITFAKGKPDVWIVKLDTETLKNKSFNKDFFELYPNPAPNFIKLSFPDSNQEKQILIIDINGKIILNKSQKANSIAIENLTKGTYLIKVITRNNIYKSRFIKN